jgi:hypothetical protein
VALANAGAAGSLTNQRFHRPDLEVPLASDQAAKSFISTSGFCQSDRLTKVPSSSKFIVAFSLGSSGNS